MAQRNQTAAELWNVYRDSSVVSAAVHYSKYTIPSLMADPNIQGAGTLEYDFQSAGALLVNSLSSKVTQALFPPGRPNFRIELDDEVREAAALDGTEESALRESANALEQSSSDRQHLHGGFAKLQRMAKLMIVTGQCLVYRDLNAGRYVVWSLQSFVTRRGPAGELMDCILKQKFRVDELPEEILLSYQANNPGRTEPDTKVDLYTRIHFNKERVATVYHEISGKPVGEEGVYPEHLCPYVVPTWNVVDGEHYARGYVEEYGGDFAKLSLLSEQQGLYELEVLQLLNLVDESGGAVVDDLKSADIGDYLPGKVDTVKGFEKGDPSKMLQIANSLAVTLTRLREAFMYTGQMRQAERVTAAEVHQLARESEATLGGTYSLLAEVWQQPLAYLSMMEVALRGDGSLLEALIADAYRPNVQTGLAALTRAAEAQNIIEAALDLQSVIPVLAALRDAGLNKLDLQKVADIVMESHGVLLSRINKDPEQLRAEAAQEQRAVAQATQDQDALLNNAVGLQDTLTGVL